LLDDEMQAQRADRFEGGSSSLEGNRFLQLKRVREEQRKLQPDDGYVPRSLGEAVNLVGTCLDMCPEYEREEREYQNNVDKLEFVTGTRRIDPAKAVKAYHRPAAGNEVPPPSDIRPPHILKVGLALSKSRNGLEACSIRKPSTTCFMSFWRKTPC
jgi:hypothetical protein